MTDEQVSKFNKRLAKLNKAVEAGELTGKDPFPSDALVTLHIRLPFALAENIKEAAKTNGRSVSAEVAARLEESMLI